MLDAEFWESQRQRLYRLLYPVFLKFYLEIAQDAMIEIGVAIDWALVNEAARAWAKAYTYDLVSQIDGTSQRFIQNTIADWIESGAPLKDLIAQIEASGVFGPVRSEMIAVTEVTRVYAEANREAWKASGVVDGMRWNTANDELVCPICGPLANKKTTLDGQFQDGYDIPPAHVNCRCWITPVVSKG